jgi:hypothetical protein
MKWNVEESANLGRLCFALFIAYGVLAVGDGTLAAQTNQSSPAAADTHRAIGGLQLRKPLLSSDGISPATPFIVADCLTQEQCLAAPLVVTNNNTTAVRTIANGGGVAFDVECREANGNVLGIILTLIPNQIQAGMSCPNGAVEMVINCRTPPCVVGWVP